MLYPDKLYNCRNIKIQKGFFRHIFLFNAFIFSSISFIKPKYLKNSQNSNWRKSADNNFYFLFA